MNQKEKDQQIQSLQSKIQELEEKLEDYSQGGIKILFSGKANSQRIARKVKPRTLREISELSLGNEEQKSKNLVIEGDNLLAMATLYQYHGKIDLIIADPPYNTGKDFRYNDRWDQDPNDPGLGDYVKADDPSRHTKWMKFMLPRIQMIKQMLKKSGVVALCIDYRELFRLGMILDEVFGENNRLGIINWQKTFALKNDSKHLSINTEYVLVYAKNIERAETGKLERSEEQRRNYKNDDNDPKGDWAGHSSSAKTPVPSMVYGIQHPFTGKIIYPPAASHWRLGKSEFKKLLEEWGSEYEEKDLEDGNPPALLIKNDISHTKLKAEKRLKQNPLPRLLFGKDGKGKPTIKRYFSDIQQGIIPTTYDPEKYEIPLEIGDISWKHQYSGHNQGATNELYDRVGKEQQLDGIKPLKLLKKIIQLWCPPNGLVLDPFGGSGTTGEAVLELNKETGTNRSFILIEQGNVENGDDYCRTLLQKRLQAAITGKWADQKEHELLGGGFKFTTLDKQINNQAILQMERTELIDTIIASRIDKYQQKYQGLQVLKDQKFNYLIAKNANNEGFFLVWNGPDKNANFTKEVYEKIVQEAKENNLKNPYHVYARLYLCQVDTVNFYQIPDSILLDFGFDLEKDRFN